MSEHRIIPQPGRGVALAALWAVLGLTSTGCLGSDTTKCVFDRICASDRICDAVYGLCILPEQLVACEGAQSGVSCQFAFSLNSVTGSSGGPVFAAGDSVFLELRTALPRLFGGACHDPIRLYCEASLPGSNATRASQYDAYACGTRGAPGGEVYYRFDSPIDGTVTVELTPHGGDLDLIAVGSDAGGGCAPDDACMAASQQSGDAVESVRFSAFQGSTYYFIVDAPGPQISGYTIRVRCR